MNDLIKIKKELQKAVKEFRSNDPCEMRMRDLKIATDIEKAINQLYILIERKQAGE